MPRSWQERVHWIVREYGSYDQHADHVADLRKRAASLAKANRESTQHKHRAKRYEWIKGDVRDLRKLLSRRADRCELMGHWSVARELRQAVKELRDIQEHTYTPRFDVFDRAHRLHERDGMPWHEAWQASKDLGDDD